MTKSQKWNENLPTGIERRRARRRPILGTFSVFIAVPRKGFHKLIIHDLSELGIGFNLDVEGESTEIFPVQVGDIIELRLYINQSLFIPLSVSVVRIDLRSTGRRIGAEFQKEDSDGYKALLSFLSFLDAIIDIAQVDNAIS